MQQFYVYHSITLISLTATVVRMHTYNSRVPAVTSYSVGRLLLFSSSTDSCCHVQAISYLTASGLFFCQRMLTSRTLYQCTVWFMPRHILCFRRCLTHRGRRCGGGGERLPARKHLATRRPPTPTLLLSRMRRRRSRRKVQCCCREGRSYDYC